LPPRLARSEVWRLSADSLDLGEGQSVVFGKSNVHESGDVVVVVLTARVVN
jgi:hypothetical protein